MRFKFHCPHCGQRIAADDDVVGKRVACPECKCEFLVPALASPLLPDQVATPTKPKYFRVCFGRTFLINAIASVLALAFIVCFARWIVVRTGQVGVSVDPRLWGTHTATMGNIISTAIGITLLPLLVCSVPLVYGVALRLFSKTPMPSYRFYLYIFSAVLAVGSFFSYVTYSSLPPPKKLEPYGKRLSERLMQYGK